MATARQVAMDKAEAKSSEEPKRVSKFICYVTVERQNLGLTQRDVAKATGLSNQNIANIELGRNCNLDTAMILAKFFEMTVDELWELVPESKQ